MHHRSSVVLVLAAAGAVTSLPAAALDLPARKPGLWELKMTFEGRSVPPQVMQQCIDAATDKQMNTFGADMGKGMCSKQEVTNVGGKIVVDSVCRIGPGTAVSHGEMTGSFDSAYTVKVTTKHDGAAMAGMPAAGTTKMSIDAKWLGACKPDQRPGDVILANGMKMNINDLQKMRGPKLQGIRPAMPSPLR